MWPGLWNDNYQRLWDNGVAYDQANCVGVSARLVQTDGSGHCVSVLSAAATLESNLGLFPNLAGWYFYQRPLEEMNGYIAAAGC